MDKLKTLSVYQKIFFQHQTSSCTSSVCLQHIFTVLKRCSESSKRNWFHKVGTINHYCRKMAKLKTLSVCQKIFFQYQTSSCTSSVCLQHICTVLKICRESSKRNWFHKVGTINHYCRKMAKLKTLSVCQKLFFQHQTSSCTSSACLLHIYKVLKRCNESSKRCWFQKVCTINHYLLGAVVRTWLS